MKSIEELEILWNAQADECNQFDVLDLGEVVAFAQEVEREACALACKTIAVNIADVEVKADMEYSIRKTGRSRNQIRDDLLIEAVISECVGAIVLKGAAK